MDIEQLKFPIGKFIKPEHITQDILNQWIHDFETFPERLERIIEHLDSDQFQLKYRPGGWNITQVVNHCADSHINSLIRFKLTLTEDKPIIRPYLEDRWALLEDYSQDNIQDALNILKGVHRKLSKIFKTLSPEQLKRTFVHPEHNQAFSIEENIGIYAWHSNHHLAHVKQAMGLG